MVIVQYSTVHQVPLLHTHAYILHILHILHIPHIPEITAAIQLRIVQLYSYASNIPCSYTTIPCSNNVNVSRHYAASIPPAYRQHTASIPPAYSQHVDLPAPTSSDQHRPAPTSTDQHRPAPANEACRPSFLQL
jgi:hypothetical protein